MNSQPVVLIIEDDADGHRLRYVLLIVAAATRDNARVVVAISERARDHPAYAPAEHALRQAGATITYFEGDATLRRVRRLVSVVRPSLVVVPDGDSLAVASALSPFPLPVRTNILVMRDPRLESGCGGLRRLKLSLKRVLLLLADRRRRCHIIYLRIPGSAHRPQFYAVDPVHADAPINEVVAMRSELELESSRFWLGVVGTISFRKGVLEVLQACELLDADAFGLVIMGPVEPSLSAALSAAMTRARDRGVEVRDVNRLLTDQEMTVAVAGLDCVVVAYDTSAPPSTMGKAAALGTRLVVAGPRCLHEFAQDLSGGTWVSAKSRSPQDLADAFVAAKSSPPMAPRNELTQDWFTPPLLAGELREVLD